MAKTKQKIVEKKKVKPPVKIEPPYPKEEKKKKSDVNFIGEELVKLSNRINEIELSLNDMNIKLKQVSGRMGL